MTSVKKGRGYVYTIQYHIVWCTKYRKGVLIGPVKDALEKILLKIAKDNNFIILEMGSDVDHIHLLIDCSPGHQIPNMLKALKGVSARLLFQSCPELKKALYGGNLWNPSYFVATVSENTEQQIAQYIKSQGGEEAG